MGHQRPTHVEISEAVDWTRLRWCFRTFVSYLCMYMTFLHPSKEIISLHLSNEFFDEYLIACPTNELVYLFVTDQYGVYHFGTICGVVSEIKASVFI